ncbi:MAG: hypothetical protein ACH37Z_17370, partial [Anaerolineae bacterium]
NNGAWASVGNSNLNGYDLTGIWGDGAGGLWVSASKGTDGACDVAIPMAEVVVRLQDGRQSRRGG